MSLWETLRLGLKNLALHKVRSLLTALGIIFGVGAVIAMLSITEGGRRETLEQIRALGTENVRILSEKPVVKERKDTEQRNFILEYGLTRRDLARMAGNCPQLTWIVPLRIVRADMWSRDKKLDVRIVATTPEYLRATSGRVGEGRFLADLDLERRTRVAVLGAGAVRKLFRLRSALGEHIKVTPEGANTEYFRVVGIMEDQATASARALQAADVNNDVYIPYSTCRSRFGDTNMKRSSGSFEAFKVEVDEVCARVRSADEVEPTAEVLRGMLKRIHPKDDTRVQVPVELLRQEQRTQKTFNIVTGSIAAIALLVGGIGIMNIMLASVLERTREIGTRRALGATRRDILRLFLTEAVVLSVAGGLIGIGLGLGGAFVIAASAQWDATISIWTVAAAFGISGVVGMIFGTYPAMKAARLDPITALRTE